MIRINLAGDAGAGLAGPPAGSGQVDRSRTLQRLLALAVVLGAVAVLLNWRMEQAARAMERRIRAIERLRALQSRPVRVLDLLSDCVQAVPGLRLRELSRKEGTFSLRGLVSGDSSRVSEFVARLQSTGELDRVELLHFQDQKGHYAFAVSFEEAATAPPPHQPSPGGSASATPPQGRSDS